nr:cobalamin B12-binding domain-containing protein [Actinomadura rugatobispora]
MAPSTGIENDLAVHADDSHGRALARTSFHVLLSGVASDSHTWNLVYLDKLLQEAGCSVTNVGPCPPDGLLVDECASTHPDLIVLSSVNGHGAIDGMRVIRRIRRVPELARTPAVIGGKLGTLGAENGTLAPRLLAAGFDRVFPDGSVHGFLGYLGELQTKADADGPRLVGA